MTRVRRTTVLPLTLLAATLAQSALAQGAQQQGGAFNTRLEPTTASAAAKAEFWAGLDDWQNFSPTSAEKHFRSALVLDSSFGLAHVFLGGIGPRSEEDVRAGELDRGVALSARASAAEGLFALAWRERVAERHGRAAQLLHSAMELLPDEPRLASEYVWELFDGSDNRRALDSAQAIRKRFPSFAPLLTPLSFLLNARGDSAGGLEAAKEYARLAPQSAASAAIYGRALQVRGRYAEAEAEYRRALTLPSAHADYPWDARNSLAEVLEVSGRTVEAQAVAMEGIARAPDALDSAVYMTVAAGTSILAGNQRRALMLLASAREKSPFTSNAAMLRIDALLAEANALFGDRGAVPTHLARLPMITAADSTNVPAWHATEYAHAGQLDSALAYADKLSAGAPPQSWRSNWAHLVRGLAYLERKQCAQAMAELRQSDSTFVEVQAARAECELQMGNHAAALAWRDRVLAQRELRLIVPRQMYARARMKRMK